MTVAAARKAGVEEEKRAVARRSGVMVTAAVDAVAIAREKQMDAAGRLEESGMAVGTG